MSWMAARPWVRPVKPATVTIVLRPSKREEAPPGFDLYLPTRTLDELGWTGKTKLTLAVGDGDDVGWLMIAPVRTADEPGVGVHIFGTGAGHISFGRVAGLFEGLSGRAPVRFDRRGDAIALAIPGTSAFAAVKRGKGRAHRAETQPEGVPAPPGAGASTKAKAEPSPDGAARLVIDRGVTINRKADEETIIHSGRTMDLTAQQAHLAQLLLKAAPSPVGETFLRGKVWGSDPDGADKMKIALRDLGKALEGLGLGLKTIKGVGVQMTGLKG